MVLGRFGAGNDEHGDILALDAPWAAGLIRHYGRDLAEAAQAETAALASAGEIQTDGAGARERAGGRRGSMYASRKNFTWQKDR
jgi:hypothetical protein